MSIRTALVITLAVVFGGSAAYLALVVLQRSAPPPADSMEVVVAAQDVPRFTQLTSAMLKTRVYPKELVPPDAVTKVEDAVERGTITGLAKEEIVIGTRLASKGQLGVAPGVPIGMRAIAIKSQGPATIVGGHLMAGNHVDVLLTVKSQMLNDPTGGTTTTLLQNIEVLAVGIERDPTPDGKSDPTKSATVTLIVTPDQANKLEVGQNHGMLQLVLRNPRDTLEAVTSVATLRETRLHRGKPITETISQWLDSVGKMVATAAARPKQPSVRTTSEKKDAAPEPAPAIRELRGTSSTWLNWR